MIKIDCNHHTLQLKNKIQVICQPFFKQHGFNYFQYLRCYQDGSYSLLLNRTDLFEHAISQTNEPIIYSAFEESHNKLLSYWFFWEDSLPEKPVAIARDKCGLHHGITFVRRSKNYYDMIAFALPENNQNANAFYLTKFKAMEHFIQSFEQQHTNLIHDVTRKSVQLTKPYQDVNCRKICLKSRRFEIQGPHSRFYVTTQEIACLRLLTQGLSYKSVARVLQLSPRTVETYLNRVKHRAQLQSTKELTDLAAICT